MIGGVVYNLVTARQQALGKLAAEAGERRPMRGRRRTQREQVASLRAIPLFNACTTPELHRLQKLVDAIEVAPGEVVTSELDETGDSFVIASGQASVVLRDRSLCRLAAGDWFGELAKFRPGAPRAATVTAITPLRVVVIERANLATVVAIPSVAQRLAVVAVSPLHDGRHARCP